MWPARIIWLAHVECAHDGFPLGRRENRACQASLTTILGSAAGPAFDSETEKVERAAMTLTDYFAIFFNHTKGGYMEEKKYLLYPQKARSWNQS